MRGAPSATHVKHGARFGFFFYWPVARNFLAFLAKWKESQILNLGRLQKCQSKTKPLRNSQLLQIFSTTALL